MDSKSINIESERNLSSNPLVAILPAAGSGTRMGAETNKILLALPFRGSSVLAYSARNILLSGLVGEMVIVTREEDLAICKEILSDLQTEFPNTPFRFVNGGTTRQESVYLGLRAVAEQLPTDRLASAFALIHDAARPFVRPQLVREVIQEAQRRGAAILATPARQTLKRVGKGSVICETIPRADIWEAQTPQVFPFASLLEAHERARRQSLQVTDDSQLYESMGKSVVVVSGEDRNIKLTTPFDLAIAHAVLSQVDVPEESL